MNPKSSLILHCYVLLTLQLSVESTPYVSNDNFHLLNPGSEKRLISHGGSRLEVFCYAGEPRSFSTLLKTVELVVKVPYDNFYYYEGQNYSSVYREYIERSWFSFSPWIRHTFRLDLFNMSCIGIETSESFKVTLKVRHIDFWRVLTLCVGTGLFFLSPSLAQNIFFHYVTGISVGIFGSLLVIVFVLSKLVPKKTGAFSILIGGWGLVIYILQYIWSNSIHLLKEHQNLVVGYITLTGLVSFAMVYRYGPISNVRSLKLVQWSLQLVSLALIFVSSQCREFSLALVLVLLLQYNFPLSWRMKVKSYWYRHFPPKQKLLSDEEYLEQSRIETKKALEDLRQFCHSPDCNAWKTMSRLKSPQRFAEFVEGSCHLSDDEMLTYENKQYLTEEELMTSDEDDTTTEHFKGRLDFGREMSYTRSRSKQFN